MGIFWICQELFANICATLYLVIGQFLKNLNKAELMEVSIVGAFWRYLFDWQCIIYLEYIFESMITHCEQHNRQGLYPLFWLLEFISILFSGVWAFKIFQQFFGQSSSLCPVNIWCTSLLSADLLKFLLLWGSTWSPFSYWLLWCSACRSSKATSLQTTDFLLNISSFLADSILCVVHHWAINSYYICVLNIVQLFIFF